MSQIAPGHINQVLGNVVDVEFGAGTLPPIFSALRVSNPSISDEAGNLTLEMNRARQAQITRELMDIVGGAEALR